MTDIAKILALPPKERDDEIRKLIVPKPWKHRFINEKYLASTRCLNCGVEYSQDIYETPCPIPDLIALGWNLAMPLYRESTGKLKSGRYAIKEKIYAAEMGDIEEVSVSDICDWWDYFGAQPHHYILAAIMAMAGEG